MGKLLNLCLAKIASRIAGLTWSALDRGLVCPATHIYRGALHADRGSVKKYAGELNSQTYRRLIAFELQIIKMACLQIPEYHAMCVDSGCHAAFAADLFLIRLLGFRRM